MPDKKLRKMLMIIRAALIMAAKAIDEYCKEEIQVQPIREGDSIAI